MYTVLTFAVVSLLKVGGETVERLHFRNLTRSSPYSPLKSDTRSYWVDHRT